ncbi:MAG: glutamate synthase (NADPH/NADH) large chain [Pontimonas sp.]
MHVANTGSPLATRMLEDPDATVAAFVKVTPRDYQAVLRTREQAESEGLDLDGDVVWNRILEVTGG